MNIIKTSKELKAYRDALNNNGNTLAFVPTMGALHEGHLSLMKEGFKHADQVIVSIFVNPTQFAPNEDFDSYPRTIEEDLRKLKEIGVSAVWLPVVEDLYPNGEEIDMHMSGVSEPLEGEFRPHFFDGVATVVSRLFKAVKPDMALFGEKDFQQLQVIRKMVKEHNVPVQIIGVETARDEDGLALSSRNAYLSKEEHQAAIKLNKILKDLAHGNIGEAIAHEMLLTAGFDKVDYCTLRNSATLQAEGLIDRALVAAWIGKTRLIDNMAVNT
ncbi:MAG: pantoate--beta-alanine ligase [Alphaproteobacteria bacterium]|nr:pantoate--beta-alanine ligase [Alphaproteobacteria bacterium]